MCTDGLPTAAFDPWQGCAVPHAVQHLQHRNTYNRQWAICMHPAVTCTLFAGRTAHISSADTDADAATANCCMSDVQVQLQEVWLHAPRVVVTAWCTSAAETVR
jgi:hypothetical protein